MWNDIKHSQIHLGHGIGSIVDGARGSGSRTPLLEATLVTLFVSVNEHRVPVPKGILDVE